MLSLFKFSTHDKDGNPLDDQDGYMICGMVCGTPKVRDVQTQSGGSFKAVEFGVSWGGKKYLNVDCIGKLAEAVQHVKASDFVVCMCHAYEEREYEGKIYGKYKATSVVVQSGSGSTAKSSGGTASGMTPVTDDNLPF